MNTFKPSGRTGAAQNADKPIPYAGKPFGVYHAYSKTIFACSLCYTISDFDILRSSLVVSVVVATTPQHQSSTSLAYSVIWQSHVHTSTWLGDNNL